MMSEEDIIRDFEKIVEESRTEDNYEYYIKLRDMLDLYKKQQKEIDKLNQSRFINFNSFKDFVKIEKYFISKDKIREKIKKYEEDYKRQDKEELYNLAQITAGKLTALEELLKENTDD